jgi:hypothetical protein
MKDNHSRRTLSDDDDPLLQHEAMTAVSEKVISLQENSTGLVLAKCDQTGVTSREDVLAFQLLHHRILAQAGDPTDPLEVMCIEQFMLANQKIGDLHVRASMATDPIAVNQYLSAAARLMTECRKGLTAIKAYRTPSLSPQVTIVKQQNLAAGDQQVALIENADGLSMPGKKMSDSKLGSNPTQRLKYEPLPELIAQPEEGHGRPAEPIAAQRPDGSRPRKAQVSRAHESSLATLNGASERSRERKSAGQR